MNARARERRPVGAGGAHKSSHDRRDEHQGTALVLDLGEWRRLTRAERERGLRHVRALRAQLRQVAS
mgnify:CR=1 FL=1